MTKYNLHAGRPGNYAFVATERNINKSTEPPIILPDELLCTLNENGLDAYMQSLSDYVVALGGSEELVDAIFRTSILIGFQCAEDLEIIREKVTKVKSTI